MPLLAVTRVLGLDLNTLMSPTTPEHKSTGISLPSNVSVPLPSSPSSMPVDLSFWLVFPGCGSMSVCCPFRATVISTSAVPSSLPSRSKTGKELLTSIVVPSSVRSTVSVDPLTVGSLSSGVSGSNQMLAARKLNSASVLWSRNTDTNPPSIGASQPTKTYCSVDFVTRPARRGRRNQRDEDHRGRKSRMDALHRTPPSGQTLNDSPTTMRTPRHRTGEPPSSHDVRLTSIPNFGSCLLVLWSGRFIAGERIAIEHWRSPRSA